jgi:hypothetical protein
MQSIKPTKQARKILKSLLIFLKAPQISEPATQGESFGLTFSKFFDQVRLPSDFPRFLYRSRIGAGRIGSTFRASRQDLEALRAHFVVFCQVMGWNARALSGWTGRTEIRRKLSLLSI